MKRQNGAALLIALMVVVLAITAGLLSAYNGRNSQVERDKITDAALAQAKMALIAYAVSRPISFTGSLANAIRPGDLPCPDINDDGEAESDCGAADGSTKQAERLGRLPWKTLGLPDLRDANGERLWYAVSSNFKERFRYTPLNSDTTGTISVRDNTGSLIQDASLGNGVVAVIIAPGPPLTRSDQTSVQARPSINPKDYLEIANGEDNADFVDGQTNGFISGPVFDSSHNLVSNDRLIWITRDELSPFLEKRVAAEVAFCLREYAAINGNQYPWAAADISFSDTVNTRFGRLPEPLFSATAVSGMSDTWGTSCSITMLGWWPNWRELVFYSVSNNHKPGANPTKTCGIDLSGVDCLSVNGTANRPYVVLVAGRILSGQSRNNAAQKNTPSNYLEGGNENGTDSFVSAPSSNSINDTLANSP